MYRSLGLQERERCFLSLFKTLISFGLFACVKLCRCLIIHLMCIATISYPCDAYEMIIQFCLLCCAMMFIPITLAHHQVVCDMEECPIYLIDCAFAFKCKFKIVHKFRGSSCLSHTSQSDDYIHGLYHMSKL